MQERKYPLKRQTEDKRDLKFAVSESVDIPSKIDLREKCPPVFDQKSIGSCTAQAGVAAYMMLKEDKDLKSRLYLYYKERMLEGTVDEDTGANMRDIGKALNKFGVCLEPLHPYEFNYNQIPSIAADTNANKYKINNYKNLSTIEDIKQYIARTNLPVMIGMEVYSSFESSQVAKTGVVPMPNVNREEMLGGHAVLVVGYDDNFGKTNKTARKHKGFLASIINLLLGNKLSLSDDDGYLIVRNSWSQDWGDHGYFYLPYSFVKKHAYDFWVIE